MKTMERWYSDRMGQDLTLARWGTYGIPVLLFPTAGGDAEEAERRRMIRIGQPFMDAGRAKFYSVDSIAGRVMTEGQASSDHQMWMFNRFHEAIAHEVVPAIYADCGGPIPIIVAGSSIGAFNSLAMICRYPDLIQSALCMSGTYGIEKFIGGRITDDFYFSSPLRFLPDLHGPALDQLRRRFVIFASGSGQWEDVGESWRAADVLGAKGIPNRVDDWGPEYAHDWPTWERMLPLYLDELLP